MYYPYLRGKLNELLCLQELIQKGVLSKKIVPVIEPVAFSSAFVGTVKAFCDDARAIAVIKNPKVGNFYDEIRVDESNIEDEKERKKMERKKALIAQYEQLINSSYCHGAFIVKRNDGTPIEPESYLINTDMNSIFRYQNNDDMPKAELTFIPQNTGFFNLVKGKKVLIEDCFHKARRNKEYLDFEDEYYSDNHLTYSKTGYEGFSDYSIIGSDYEESGFAPVAIAIHVLYFDANNTINVHHFVSDSNDDNKNQPKKFKEAMEKMYRWEYFDKVSMTRGIRMLMDYYDEGKFPGLGMIKRCALMHHLEIISIFLEDIK